MKSLLCKVLLLSMILMYSSERYSFLYNETTKVEAIEINSSIDEGKVLLVPIPEGSVLI